MEPLFHHALVPIDGSEPSLHAVEMALRITSVCPSCALTVIYVIDKLVVTELLHLGKHSEKEVEVEFSEQAARYLNLVQKQAREHGVSADCRVRKGDPFEEIIAAANDLHADLIIMGHTGRRGTSRVLIGSVTQRVLDYSPCPVLVTK